MTETITLEDVLCPETFTKVSMDTEGEAVLINW